MKISLSWLRDYVSWEGSQDELETLLTNTGLSVESIETRGADFPKVVVAQILESKQHPNADRLSVCQVDDGSGQPRQIVCGAKNYKVGDKVPLALPGAVLPGDFKIKVGKLRGVESEGMMCSAKELQMAEDADGLLILPADTQVGLPISALYPADTVMELEITPNRPDWLGHIGVAREVSAFAKLPLKRPEISSVTLDADASVRIEDEGDCTFYTARKISGVKVGPSPEWLKLRLEAIGLRSINNVVDVTNYVMMETGQPLHAFDAAKVQGGIAVRRSQQGEALLALDGVTYKLTPDHLVIADEVKPLALAGVMGGEESGVTETTTDIILESANFHSSLIRRTTRSLDVHTDSSYRFERKVDPFGVAEASARAVDLILQVAGGTPAATTAFAGQKPTPLPQVSLAGDRCRKLLGADVSDQEIEEALTALGLQKDAEVEPGTVRWNIPSHRLDLVRDVDLIEEVSRMIGIDRVPSYCVALPAATTEADQVYDFHSSLRSRLGGLGFFEARTSTLISEASSAEWANVVKLKNPLGEDQSVLRPSLLPGLLTALQRNLHNGARLVRLYEIGKVYSAEGVEESFQITLVATGDAEATSWRSGTSRDFDIFDLKGLVESLVPGKLDFKKIAQTSGRLIVEVLSGEVLIGRILQLSPAEARALDARGPVVAVELNSTALRSVQSSFAGVREIPKFPSVARDIALVLAADQPCAEVLEVIKGAKEALLEDVEVFDVFRDESGEKLAADRKSIAFSLTFRSPERTLTTEEVNAASQRIKAQLKERLAVEFRE